MTRQASNLKKCLWTLVTNEHQRWTFDYTYKPQLFLYDVTTRFIPFFSIQMFLQQLYLPKYLLIVDFYLCFLLL